MNEVERRKEAGQGFILHKISIWAKEQLAVTKKRRYSWRKVVKELENLSVELTAHLVHCGTDTEGLKDWLDRRKKIHIEIQAAARKDTSREDCSSRRKYFTVPDMLEAVRAFEASE